MKEILEVQLEREKIKLLQSSVVTIQRHVRTYLVRKQYQSYRASAIRIQSAYRGYKCRSHFRKIRSGIIRAQANWRMKRQQREYIKVIIRIIDFILYISLLLILCSISSRQILTSPFNFRSHAFF